MVRRIIEASGRDLAIEFDHGKPSIKTSLYLDCARAEAELGWRRQVSFDDGIHRTLDWYRENVPDAD